MKVIGITGVMGSGKSTLSEIFRRLGYTVVDLDHIGKRLIEQKAIKEEIGKIFGEDCLSEGKISRERLAKKVFEDPEALRRLEEIIHPEIIKEMEKQIREKEREGEKIIFVDGPLIFEKGLHKKLDMTIVVSAREERIKERLKKRNIEDYEFERRKRYQLSLDEKERLADYIIYNNGTIEELEREARKFLENIGGG